MSRWICGPGRSSGGASLSSMLSCIPNSYRSYCATPKLWAFGILFGCVTTCAYAFAYFLAIILVGMGFSDINAQLLVAPPGLFSVFVAFGLAWVGDKFVIRAPIIMFQAVLTIIGLSMVNISCGQFVLQPTEAFHRLHSTPRCPFVTPACFWVSRVQTPTLPAFLDTCKTTSSDKRNEPSPLHWL